MMYEGMTVEEMELAVFDLECEDCASCPFAAVCGEHELFWGCGVWEDSMSEDLQGLHQNKNKNLKIPIDRAQHQCYNKDNKERERKETKP